MKRISILFTYIFLVICLDINLSIAGEPVSKEITFSNGENILSGTLTVPDTVKKYPAVILVTGSGQQNRDEEISGFKVFKMIADTLTSKGIAVLRYDDRGYGKSKGKVKTATTYDFAQDAKAGVIELAKFEFIDKNNIGILGHSEGGMIANIVAAENPELIKFVVMMSGPAVNCGDIILYQIEVMNKVNGATDDEVKSAVTAQKGLYKLLNENKSKEEIKQYMTELNLAAYEKMPDEQKKYITDKNQFASAQAEMAIQQVMTPWFKYFVNYEPSKDISKVKCRIIAMFGEKDSQVEPNANSKSFEETMKLSNKTNYVMKVFPKANHLFQSANTGLATEFANLPKEFVPGFLDFIVEQIKISVK